MPVGVLRGVLFEVLVILWGERCIISIPFRDVMRRRGQDQGRMIIDPTGFDDRGSTERIATHVWGL